MMARIRKIVCENDYRGRECGKWLARVEHGMLFIKCPRCGGYQQEPLSNFLGDVNEELARVEARIAFVEKKLDSLEERGVDVNELLRDEWGADDDQEGKGMSWGSLIA